MGRVEGKVAFITGAGRGQGRAHAIRLAQEGADIVAVDICQQINTVDYPLATEEDLAETVSLVEAEDRRAVAMPADVRSSEALEAAVSAGLAEFGKIDIVCANAGIVTFHDAVTMGEDVFTDVVDTNLTGVWRTVKATVPQMIERGEGGSIVLTSSINGRRGVQNIAHYTAAKHGVVGLMRALVNELGPERIRVNCVMPGSTSTPMIHNDATYRLFRPDLENPQIDDVREVFENLSVFPETPWMEPTDISNAVLFLASEEARFVTGVCLPVDAGYLEKAV